jgi:hypothetical protein
LYLSCMSAPVSRIVRITRSREIKCWPSPAQGHLRRIDRFDRRDGIALDTRHLHQPAHRVAGQAQVVFQADFCGVAQLLRRRAEDLRQPRRRHGAGRTDLTLAAHFGAGDRGVLFAQNADGRRA